MPKHPQCHSIKLKEDSKLGTACCDETVSSGNFDKYSNWLVWPRASVHRSVFHKCDYELLLPFLFDLSNKDPEGYYYFIIVLIIALSNIDVED